MAFDFVGSFAGVPGAAIGMYLYHRRIDGRLSDQARDQLRGLPLFGRWRLRRLLLRGEAVKDPRIAGAAAEYAASLHADYDMAWVRWVLGFVAAMFVGFAIWMVALGLPWAAVICAVAAVFVASPLWRNPRLRRRLARAEAANQALVATGDDL